MGVISDIIRYLSQPPTDEEIMRPYLEEQRRLKEYRRIKRLLPKAIRELESATRKLKELASD